MSDEKWKHIDILRRARRTLFMQTDFGNEKERKQYNELQSSIEEVEKVLERVEQLEQENKDLKYQLLDRDDVVAPRETREAALREAAGICKANERRIRAKRQLAQAAAHRLDHSEIMALYESEGLHLIYADEEARSAEGEA